MKKLKELFSIMIAKQPARFVLLAIILLNAAFFVLAALVISYLSPVSNEFGFWESLYRTITMVLDAGFISEVVTNVSDTHLITIFICLAVVIIGMVMFTGAVIGYLTNFISSFIEHANLGQRRLTISEHTVILNWNNRASEILNDLMFSDKPEKIVVLTSSRTDEIRAEIHDRLADTIIKENNELIADKEEQLGRRLTRWERYRLIRRYGLKNRLTWFVRQGDTFSSKHLSDISLENAKSIVILGRDDQNSICRYERIEAGERRGNTMTVKTLVQVAEIADSERSRNDQMIVVEVDDVWTMQLVNMVVAEKRKNKSKCHIVPVAVNRILGQMLAQFCIMPELNQVYRTLFSNKGSAFYTALDAMPPDEDAFIAQKIATMKKTIPLTHMTDREGISHFFYVAEKSNDYGQTVDKSPCPVSLAVNPNFHMPHQNVIILGHNSKSHFIMNGFNAFRAEWNGECDGEIMDILVIDDAKGLEQENYYRDYPYVRCVEADIINGKERIYAEVSSFVDAHIEDTSILILSNDKVPTEELDANALTYLLYMQDIANQKASTIPNFDREKIDIIVEILNPKNYDVVYHYSVRNVIISNRYISKMVTQIGKDCSLFDFYNDILTYDSDKDDTSAHDDITYESKEIYAKRVCDLFLQTPPRCTADELIRALYDATPPENRAIALGYVKKGTGKTVLFSGDLAKINVELAPQDKLIVFSNH